MRIKRFISRLRDSISHAMACAEFSSFSKAVDKALSIEGRQLQARATHDQRKRPREDVAVESERGRQGRFRGGIPSFSLRGGHQPQVSYRNDGMASQSSRQTYRGSLGGNQRRDSSSFIRGSSSSAQTRVPCKTCGRVHGGVCYREIGVCFSCGQHEHYMSQCPVRGASLQHMTARPASSYATVMQPIGQPHVSRGQYVAYVPAEQPHSEGVGQTPSQIEGSRSRGQNGGAQAIVFALTPKDAQASNSVATGTLYICGFDASVLFDPCSTHSYVAPHFAVHFSTSPTTMECPLVVSTPVGDRIRAELVYRNIRIQLRGHDMFADLILLDMLDFDIILGMDWLSTYYATLDCREKVITFCLPSESEFTFMCDASSSSPYVISALRVEKLLKKGCQAFLAMIIDSRSQSQTLTVNSVPIVFEFMDVFPEDLPGLPPVRDVEFCIDLVPGTEPISIPPYRMAPAELRELKA
ncbi:unnamed protein product [Rhodiola kirilowii]